MVQTESQFINLDFWISKLPELKDRYNTDNPFPYIVIDNFFIKEELQKAENEFPPVQDEGWIHYLHFNEKKHGLNKMGLIPPQCQKLIRELYAIPFLNFLEKLTGIDNLLPDESLEGGGLHQSINGGFLNIHADFTVHPHNRKWRRRVNVLIYLNGNWKEEYKGHLELWRKDMTNCAVKILPLFNRCVIFNTDHDSYHGVPDIICCPDDITRKSIALYYFTEEKSKPKRINTNYQAKPNESLTRKIMIYLDKQILWTYSRAKSFFGLNDDLASKVLRIFHRKNSKQQ